MELNQTLIENESDFYWKVGKKKKVPNRLGTSAVRTGLEPVTSCVTGRHSNQLN